MAKKAPQTIYVIPRTGTLKFIELNGEWSWSLKYRGDEVANSGDDVYASLQKAKQGCRSAQKLFAKLVV